jgi:hypothetical protein
MKYVGPTSQKVVKGTNSKSTSSENKECVNKWTNHYPTKVVDEENVGMN